MVYLISLSRLRVPRGQDPHVYNTLFISPPTYEGISRCLLVRFKIINVLFQICYYINFLNGQKKIHKEVSIMLGKKHGLLN